MRLPGSHSQQAFQTFGDWLQRRPLPSSASGGWWVLRQLQCPWLGFNTALPLPSRPYGSHLTGYTGCPEEIPLMGSYYIPGPKASRVQASGRGVGKRLEARQARVFSPELAYQVSIPALQKLRFPETLARAIAVAAGPNETPPTRGFFVLVLCH